VAELRTSVELPGYPHNGWGYDCWDRKTRAQAIAEYRRFVVARYRDALAQLEAANATADGELIVRVHRGSKVIEELNAEGVGK